MIEIHYLEHSRAQRVVWFAEELGLKYRLVSHSRDPKTRLVGAEVKGIHPLGKLPIVVDGESVLAESAVILEYLARTYDGQAWLVDPGETSYWSYQYWLHYAESSLMTPLLVRLIFSFLKGRQVPALIRPLSKRIAQQVDRTFTNPQIKTHFEYVNEYLKDNPWFCGDQIKLCDVQMAFPLEAALASRAVGRGAYPYIERFVSEIQQRPAYLRALAVTGDYEFGPA